jgi:hypothetical protein
MNRFLIILGSLLLCVHGFSQKKEIDTDQVMALEQEIRLLNDAVRSLQKLKVSGYIQTQYQYAEVDADGINFKLPNRANTYEVNELKSYGRFGVRRGRIKVVYEEGIVQAVFQTDITERGVTLKDANLVVKDPLFGTNMLKAGVFALPFGHEVAWSSSFRESPERARIIQSLFPDVFDLGAMLTLQPAKTSPLNILKLEAAWVAGNGIRPQISSRMDFLGRLSIAKPLGKNAQLGLGISAYLGGVLQTDEQRYVVKDRQFALDSNTSGNIGRYAKRQYFGAEMQFRFISAAGATQVRGEYIVGEHPGNASGAYDFKLTTIPPGPVYMRKISGGYVVLTQDLGVTPVTFVVKYDRYNPNTGVSGNDIGVQGSDTGTGDISSSTVGLGFLWHIKPMLRLTAYYDIVKNETTENLKNTKNEQGAIVRYGYESNRKENVFTLRLQYRF